MEKIYPNKLDSISIITPALSGGGAEKVAVNLANYYASNGHDVDLVVFMKRGPYLALVSESVNLVDLGVSRTRNVFFKLRKYLKNNRNRLVLSVIRDGNIFTGLASFGLRMKKLAFREASTLDSIYSKPLFSKFLYKFLMRLSYSQAQSIIANSDDTKRDLVSSSIVPTGKVQVIVNPVLSADYKSLLCQPTDDPWLLDNNLKVILAVGRLHHQKNFDFLIDVFNDVYKKFDSTRLLIVGAGDEKSQLLEKIVALGLGDVARIVNFQQNIFPYYAHAHVFALTSRWEGFGNVIVEALSAGTPVVATNCPGGPKMILQNGKYGKLVSPGDNAGFVTALLYELARPKHVNFELIDYAQKFNVANVAHQYLQVMSLVDDHFSPNFTESDCPPE